MIEFSRIGRGLRGMAMMFATVVISGAATPVFRGGERLLSIVVAADASEEEREAAEELARVLGVMSGLSWSVQSEGSSARTGFHVGRTRAAAVRGAPLKTATDLLAPKPDEIGPDGFRIRSGEGSVFVEGATPEATHYAVAWLLQREAGVRWYVPGSIGEVIPRRAEWELPDMDVTHAPAYVSREIYDLSTPEARVWARRNGLRGRLEFNHALNRVFPPPILAEKPEWAPLVRGQRYQLASPDDYNWQPNLALTEVAEHAAQTAIAAFVREPGRASFSLAMNDTVRFDQSEATRVLVEPLRYFRGRPDYSPLVFGFMNRAAGLVASSGAGRYLGCLAYFWCENPPPFPVHARVMPYVTTDRSQYYDPAYRAADLDLMSRWGASGGRAFGLWEYAEGGHFLVPRLPLASLSEAIREGWRRGARGYFAEVSPQWGFDAFKVWMLARLLWEPDRSPVELADDFHRGFFGAAAAPMRRFFEGCEAQWMAQSGPPYWLKFYQQEDQALLFPASVCHELRGHIEAARKAVASEPVLTARVEMTSKAFAATEAYVRFDAERRQLGATADDEFTGRAPAEQAVADSIRRLLRKKADFRRRFDEASRSELPALTGFSQEPFLRNDPVPRLLWLAGQKDPLAPRRILRAVGPEAGDVMEWQIPADALANGTLVTAENLTRNPVFAEAGGVGQEPSFLFPRDGVLPADWEVRATPTETGRVARVPAGPAARALRIEGAWDTQVFQWHPASPGGVYVATARLRGGSSPGSDAGLFMTFLTKDGKVTGTHRMQSLPKGSTLAWRAMALADRAPEDVTWVGVGIGASRQVAGDWFEVAELELRGLDGRCGP